VSFLASIDQLQKVVKQEKRTIEVKDAELHTKQVLIKTLEKQTLTLQKELEEAIDYNATAHPNKLSASKVYGSIVNDVIKADEELVNSRYKLGNISLNLKTTVEKGPEGTVFGLLDFETAKGINGAAISDISIDIVPNVAAAINEGQKMPDILGLNATAELQFDIIPVPPTEAQIIRFLPNVIYKTATEKRTFAEIKTLLTEYGLGYTFAESVDEDTITGESTLTSQLPVFDPNKPRLIRADDVITLE
jgi:hypothetical protein